MPISDPAIGTQPDPSESVRNGVDPRIDDSVRASTVQIDQGYLHQVHDHSSTNTARNDVEKDQLSKKTSPAQDEVIYLDFEPNDPRNPFNFSTKYVLTITLGH